jgi:hypothetical protein
MNLSELFDSEKELLQQTRGFNVSERYKVIPTIEVIEEFHRYGFEVDSIVSGGTRTRQGYQKHMIRMSVGEKLFGGEIKPQVIVHNSYDGTRALNIHVGFFRFVCENGIVAGSNIVKPLRIVHSSSSWKEELDEFIDTYDDKYREQKEFIMELKEKPMSLDEAYHLAEQAYKLRHYDSRISMDLVDPLELLIAKRREDRGDRAWHRFQVMQESLVNGYFHKYSNDGSVTKAKILTNIDEIVRFNGALSDLFSEVLDG